MRQLEHRIGDLPALADRLQAARDAALAEARSAPSSALAQPFKHADALAAASARCQQIAAQMRERQQPAPDAAHDDTAELQRLTRANFPAPRPRISDARPSLDAATGPAPTPRVARTLEGGARRATDLLAH